MSFVRVVVAQLTFRIGRREHCDRCGKSARKQHEPSLAIVGAGIRQTTLRTVTGSSANKEESTGKYSVRINTGCTCIDWEKCCKIKPKLLSASER